MKIVAALKILLEREREKKRIKRKREREGVLVQSVGFLGRDPSILVQARTKLHAGVAVGVLIASGDTALLSDMCFRVRANATPPARAGAGEKHGK